MEQTTPTVSSRIDAPKSVGEAGEVEQLVGQANSAVDNLEKEVEMLVVRLQNVLRQEEIKDKSQAQASPRSTQLGGQLDSVVYRTDRVASNIRTIREMLGN